MLGRAFLKISHVIVRLLKIYRRINYVLYNCVPR